MPICTIISKVEFFNSLGNEEIGRKNLYCYFRCLHMWNNERELLLANNERILHLRDCSIRIKRLNK